MRRLALLLAASLAVACSPPPRPGILAEVDRTRSSAASTEAKTLAPQAFLAAERLAQDAVRANDGGDRASAQLLAEQALAAYAHAAVLARLARADARESDAKKRVEDASKEFAAVDAEEQRVAAEANDAELAYRVARDALPVAGTEPASADREQARVAAARSIALDAKLLCVATQMLAKDTDSLEKAFHELEELDAELAKKPLRAPIDAAVRLRSTCLSELSKVRRDATTAAPQAGAPDALLDELGKAGFSPRRDDRGVAVTLRDAFQGGAVSKSALPKLLALGQVQREHPTFPLLAVVHSAHGAPTPRDAERAESVKKALVDAGAGKVEARTSGDAAPAALPGRADSAAQNERLELVFVAPTF
ncbi:MAG TPA: hypothetical protein VHE30_07470 [Polyangiaceae bacterium]|nr:hypothetical protein [Polyangiaceae bacterium]